MSDGYWTPNFTAKNGKIHKKQVQIFNCRKRFVLVCGGRRTGKTIAVLHKVLRHMWETPGARVALITKTTKVGKEGGVWSDLIEMVIPEWINSNMVGTTDLPLEYVSESKGIPGPRTDAATRTSTFRIRNWWGGESELIHLSLDNVAEVEAKFKGLRYSMIWFSELSEFDSLNVFTATIQTLRIGENENQQFIADTNPSVDGTESWIYQNWFVYSRQKQVPEKYAKGVVEIDKKKLAEDPAYKMRDPQTEWEKYRNNFEVIEVKLEDNPFLSDDELNELVGSNVEMNPGDYDRNVLGIWAKGFGHRGKLFSDILIESTHFISPAIDLDIVTIDLFCGWDIGGVNNAFVILEQKFYEDKPVWCVIDEVVTIDERISTEQFTFLCMDKMVKLEQHYGKQFNWFHWSDDTALNMYRPGVDGYDASIVKRVSGGFIELNAAAKPDGSIESGIRMIRRAIRENRFYCGANCPKTQEMLLNISEGKTKPVDDTPLKHPFDAMRYPIYMETRKREANLESKPKSSDRGSMISFG